MALTFSVYILKPIFPECDPPTESTRMLAAACICKTLNKKYFRSNTSITFFFYLFLISLGLLTFVNCWDVKWSTRVQDTFTYAKLVALFIIIGTGIYQLCTGKASRRLDISVIPVKQSSSQIRLCSASVTLHGRRN